MSQVFKRLEVITTSFNFVLYHMVLLEGRRDRGGQSGGWISHALPPTFLRSEKKKGKQRKKNKSLKAETFKSL